jgi:hypothetical protein
VKNGEVLVGASVVILGTDRGAATGVHGEYAVAGVLPGKHELVASYVGYRALKTSITLDSLTGVRVDFWMAATPIRIGPVG